MGFTRFIQSLDDLVDRKISNIHTSLPAKIVGYSNGRVDVQPYGKYFVGDVSLDYPVLLGCPVTSSGVASPINVGDDCLVLVTEQSLENWLNNTSGNEVNEKWSLSNCIAVCGLQKLESAEQAQANSSGHSVVGNLDSTGSVTIQGMDVKDSIEECEDRVDVVEERVDTVEDAVEECEEQVGECTAKVGELEDDVEELNSTKANKSDIVDNLTTDDATKMLSAKQGKVLSESKATTEALTAHTGNTNNPHGVTKAQVGLENVGNFKAVSTEASQGLTDAEKENAKANIGAYAVPSSGIPDTDLSASVQASLSLANTSLQSSALVTEVSGSSTDIQIPSAKAVWDDVYSPLDEDKAGRGELTNRNILDNSWFQINQRGLNAYPLVGSFTYCVDRWIYDGMSSTTVVVNGNGVTLTTTIADYSFFQRFEDSTSDLLLGKAVTGSIMLSDGTIASGTIQIPSIKGATHQYIDFCNINNDYKIAYRFESSSEHNDCRFAIIKRTNNSNSISIRAVKLETGSISTLAMDTAPNFATELLKCQRYYQILAKGAPCSFAIGWSPFSGSAYFDVNLICEMATTPSLVYSGIRVANYSTDYDIISMNLNTYNRSNININVSTSAPAGNIYILYGNVASSLLYLTCEL